MPSDKHVAVFVLLREIAPQDMECHLPCTPHNGRAFEQMEIPNGSKTALDAANAKLRRRERPFSVVQRVMKDPVRHFIVELDGVTYHICCVNIENVDRMVNFYSMISPPSDLADIDRRVLESFCDEI
ncbi:MAG: hypothetical protein WCT24_03120 [Patescibacteria group bacterium]